MKSLHRIFHWILILLLAGCLLLMTGWLDGRILPWVSALSGKRIQETWPGYLHAAALAVLLISLGLWVFFQWLLPLPTLPARLRRLREVLLAPPDAGTAEPRWRFSWVDGLILTAFLLVGFVLFLEKIQGPYPSVRLGSDEGNIASFAAAQANPALFAGDGILSEPDNLRSYSTLNIPILNLLKPWTGTYSLAFAWFLPPQTFLTLAGFYVLGLALFAALRGRRFYALLLAVVLAVPYQINLFEAWGISLTPVTRFTFQAVLPWLLAALIHLRRQPVRARLVGLATISAAAGLMAFVHPVSTPAWAFAIWLGMLACLPANWPWRKTALAMLLFGLLTAAAVLPYARNYLDRGGEDPAQKPPYELVVQIIDKEFPSNIRNVPAAVSKFIRITAASGLLPVGLALLGVLLLLKWNDRRPLHLLLLWLAGLLLISLLVPWIEQRIEEALRITPLQTELVRGIRYVVFFLLLFSTWSLAELDHRLSANAPGSQWRSLPRTLALVLVVGWVLSGNLQEILPTRFAACATQGRLLCPEYTDDDRIVQAVAEKTPPGAAVFTTLANRGDFVFSLPVRYEGLRALVFSYKDRGQLVTAHSPQIVTWDERRHAMNALDSEDIPDKTRMDSYIALARAWGADFVIADFRVAPSFWSGRSDAVIYENDTYLLIRVGE